MTCRSDDDFERLPVELQQAIARGDVTIEELESRADASDVCPACGRRGLLNQRSGLCAKCHYRRLLDAFRDREREHDARREYWRDAQRRHRIVICTECGAEFSPRRSATLCPSCRTR